MHRSIKLVSPRGIRKNSLDAELHFCGCLLLANGRCEPMNDLFPALRKIFRAVIKNLRAIMRRRLCPAFGLARGFHRIANIFAITQRRLAEQTSVRRAHLHAVARIRTRLLAADVKLYGTVDRGRARIRTAIDSVYSGCPISRRICEKWASSNLQPASARA